MDNATFLLKTAEYLATQRERCSDGTNVHARCLYWRADGNRCAVGAHLTEETAKELEAASKGGLSISHVYEYAAAAESGSLLDPRPLHDIAIKTKAEFGEVDHHIMRKAQSVHDREPRRDAEARKDMVERLAGIAIEYDLPETAKSIRAIEVVELSELKAES